ncbi:MAG: AAA family ATPase [Nocardioides sp.]
MIRFERSSPPAILSSARARAADAAAVEFFAAKSKANRQRDFDFDQTLLTDPETVIALLMQTSGRCTFCGIRLEVESTITGHYRPPQGAIDSDGAVSRVHYSWLAYQWNNLIPLCEYCALAKGSKFPTRNQRAKSRVKDESALAAEAPMIIDPFHEDPEQLLTYLPSGYVVADEDRARATIEILNLNRPELLEERSALASEVKEQVQTALRLLERGQIEDGASIISDLYEVTAPHAAVRRQFVNQQAQFRARLMTRLFASVTGDPTRFRSMSGSLPRITNQSMRDTERLFFYGDIPITPRMEYVSPKLLEDDPLPVPWTPIEPAAISHVEIRNFLGVEHLEIMPNARVGEGRWTMLLGENGAGKTTVLKAVALALGGPQGAEELRLTPSRVLRQNTKHGSVRLWLTGTRSPMIASFARGEREIRFEYDRRAPVIAFGPNRLLAGPGKIDLNPAVQIRNLFDPSSPLSDPKRWIGDLDESQFDAVARALKRVLVLDEEATFSRRRGRLRVELPHGAFYLETLSAGYQAMARAALDVMRFFLFQWGSLEAAEGLVLIDELGAHLHPRWQMRVVGGFRSAFPRVQVMATTHDPLCLRGLRNGEVVVLRRRGTDVYALLDLPPVEGLAVDQLLTSEHFGLNSTLDPVTESLLTEFQSLLALEGAGEYPSRRIQQLREELQGRRLLGATLRERLALEAADEYLGRERLVKSETERLGLKQETRTVLREIWSRTE